jgi:hypothetical protein
MSNDADWSILLVYAPGTEPEPAGVLLLDRQSNRLFVRLKPLLHQTDETILEVWQDLAADLDRKASALGGAEVLDWLECTASNTFRVSERTRLEAADLSGTLLQLYKDHVSDRHDNR